MSEAPHSVVFKAISANIQQAQMSLATAAALAEIFDPEVAAIIEASGGMVGSALAVWDAWKDIYNDVHH